MTHNIVIIFLYEGGTLLNREIYSKFCDYHINKLNIRNSIKKTIRNDIMNDLDTCHDFDTELKLGRINDYLASKYYKYNINQDKLFLNIPISHYRLISGILLFIIAFALIKPSAIWNLIAAIIFSFLTLYSLFKKSYLVSFISAFIASSFIESLYFIDIEINFLPLILILFGIRILFPTNISKLYLIHYEQADNNLTISRIFNNLFIQDIPPDVTSLYLHSYINSNTIDLTTYDFPHGYLIIFFNCNLCNTKIFINDDVDIINNLNNNFGNLTQTNVVTNKKYKLFIFGDACIADVTIRNK